MDRLINESCLDYSNRDIELGSAFEKSGRNGGDSGYADARPDGKNGNSGLNLRGQNEDTHGEQAIDS